MCIGFDLSSHPKGKDGFVRGHCEDYLRNHTMTGVDTGKGKRNIV